ncbi:MAG: DUF2757 family protein [Pelotomaculum sp.]|uniref:Hypothetical membrane protein n=1 Tax=Pelotomaculum thermopropionicum (strain DSM 13744 / JCM 10971 / SI) TaxID=370438 RepID=A5D635_PELTS|nr:DUF2757 family protein [Pelotomaculum sp.]BAF58296.1 hypothetical membrane protein [Pelotomaculum thermopropionicum SI]
MKLLYVCECCDAVVGELSLPVPPAGGAPAGLTGLDREGIIKPGEEGERVILTSLCDDCRETLYGGPGSTFFNGPALH